MIELAKTNLMFGTWLWTLHDYLQYDMTFCWHVNQVLLSIESTSFFLHTVTTGDVLLMGLCIAFVVVPCTHCTELTSSVHVEMGVRYCVVLFIHVCSAYRSRYLHVLCLDAHALKVYGSWFVYLSLIHSFNHCVSRISQRMLTKIRALKGWCLGDGTAALEFAQYMHSAATCKLTLLTI